MHRGAQLVALSLHKDLNSTDTAELCCTAVGLQEAMTATTGDPARQAMTAAILDMRGAMTGAIPLSGAMTELATLPSTTATRGGLHPQPMGVLCPLFQPLFSICPDCGCHPRCGKFPSCISLIGRTEPRGRGLGIIALLTHLCACRYDREYAYESRDSYSR